MEERAKTHGSVNQWIVTMECAKVWIRVKLVTNIQTVMRNSFVLCKLLGLGNSSVKNLGHHTSSAEKLLNAHLPITVGTLRQRIAPTLWKNACRCIHKTTILGSGGAATIFTTQLMKITATMVNTARQVWRSLSTNTKTNTLPSAQLLTTLCMEQRNLVILISVIQLTTQLSAVYTSISPSSTRVRSNLLSRISLRRHVDALWMEPQTRVSVAASWEHLIIKTHYTL